MKILIMIWVSVVTSICIGFMVSDFIGSDYDKKQNARLNKLEAASTTAQQPQERHYFDTVENSPDTMLLKRGCSYTIKGDYQRGIVIICK